MSTEVNMRWHGDKVNRRQRAGAARGLELASEHVLGVSNNRVPLQEGTLQDTGTASSTEDEAAVSYDGPYAVYQHERLDLQHDSGRQAKYLETALVDEQETVARIIAQQLRRELGG